MFRIIYIEKQILEHPRALDILARYPDATRITCNRYTEIFNRKSQDFRLQKKLPALILASKFNNFIHSTPGEYHTGAQHNYYFSHMLNCIYDCRYCFLQGMYRSAHFVLFVNYEDFVLSIKETIDKHKNDTVCFFSGYDCDSLAMEPVSHFCEYFLPFFAKYPECELELRTKSVQIRHLLKTEPLDNCIIAFSFTPDKISRALETGVPGVENRLHAIEKLQKHGWRIGLRFDPLIYDAEYQSHYHSLFNTVFRRINPELLHSVSLGAFRLPVPYFKVMQGLYPEEPLFAGDLVEHRKQVSYASNLEQQMLEYCHSQIRQHYPNDNIFVID